MPGEQIVQDPAIQNQVTPEKSGWQRAREKLTEAAKKAKELSRKVIDKVREVRQQNETNPRKGLQELANATTTEQSTTKVDTDSEENRKKRIEGQHDVEANIDSTFGKGVSDRMARIRKGIFKDISNVKGDPVDEVRTSELGGVRGAADYYYANNYQMRERFLPQFTADVDVIYAKIKELPEPQRQEAVLRLASVIFTEGTVLHPYIDGNGQTLKLLAMSYLHELGGNQFKDKYFPDKLTARGENRDNNINTPIIRPAMELPFIIDLNLSPEEYARFGEYWQVKKDIMRMEQYKQMGSRAFNQQIYEEAQRIIATQFPNTEEREKLEEKYKEYQQEMNA